MATFVASSTNSTTGNTSLSLPVPSGVQAGDLLIAIVNVNDNAEVITPPVGWTALDSAPVETGSLECGAWYRIYQTGVSGPTWTITAIQKIAGAIVAFRGVDNTTPIAAVGARGTRSSSSASTVAPSVTTTAANQTVVGVYMEKSSSANSVTLPGIMTSRAQVFGSGAGQASAVIGSFEQAGAGAVGALTATYNVASGAGYGLLFALTNGPAKPSWVGWGIPLVLTATPPAGLPLIFGAAIMAYPGTGHTYAQEVDAHIAACGGLPLLRTYDGGMPTTWSATSGSPGSTNPTTGDWQNRASWHSVKPDVTQVISGSLDSQITGWINSIPVTGKRRMITMWHEPENDFGVAYTAAQWKQAAHHFGELVRAAAHPDVLYGPIFMSKFTLGDLDAMMSSSPEDLFAVCDFVGWDPYNEASANDDYDTVYQNAGYYYDDCLAWTRQHTLLPLAFGEIGYVPDPLDLQRRADWLTATEQWAIDNGVIAVAYFDASISTPWYLRIVRNTSTVDQPSIDAWSDIYSRYPA